jgi:hypothetical protein
MLVSVHVDPFHLTASPALSTTSQNVEFTHDTAVGNPVVIGLEDQLQTSPVKVRARPAPSTTTQNVALAHDAAVKVVEPSISVLSQSDALYIMALPLVSTAPQNDVLLHDTDVRSAPGSM